MKQVATKKQLTLPLYYEDCLAVADKYPMLHQTFTNGGFVVVQRFHFPQTHFPLQPPQGINHNKQHLFHVETS